MSHYRVATAAVEETKLTPQRLKRILAQYAVCPEYRLAAAAAGVNRQTLFAWRQRGRMDIECMGDEVVDQMLELRTAVPIASWETIEAQLGIDVSLFARLVFGLEASELEWVNRRLAVIVEASLGRKRTVVTDKGQVVVEEVAPTWTAAAWQLERMVPGFQKRGATRQQPEEDDVEAGYAQFAADLDALNGAPPE